MKSLKIFVLLSGLAIIINSCDALQEALLEPVNDNHSTFERVYNDAPFAEGLLISAYTRIPTNSLSFNDVATDDAVINIKLNNYRRMATGEWSAIFDPLSQWNNCNQAIMYINQFLSIVDSVNWKWTNPQIRKLLAQRFKGEAYALRGLFKYHLLQTVGGIGANGQLLGIPIYNSFIKTPEEFNTPRSTFEESMASIYADYDKALEYLVIDDYKDVPNNASIPPEFSWVNKFEDYNIVYGKTSIHRISGRIVKALKARAALLEASPAFNPTNDLTKWEKAALYAGTVLSTINGPAGLDPNGHRWYIGTYVDALKVTTTGQDQPEMIWRRPIAVSNSRESANFPPSLFGSGNVNPTQNIVNAFPMSNGYPITHPSSGFNPSKPYTGRDPRLSLYIIFNGSTYKSKVITTGIGGGVNARDSIETSTRTGYYLKKHLREDVNVDPASPSTKNHYEVHMRYTELFLIYAEAANEAWGPDGKGPFTFSAREVLAAIRKRAGIAQPDNYLASVSTKDEMRELIRNERRLELCFEGFRFWDLRRWKSDLTEPAKGISINKDATSFEVVEVEKRAYNNDFMHYGPIPQTEILKFPAIIQNRGW